MMIVYVDFCWSTAQNLRETSLLRTIGVIPRCEMQKEKFESDLVQLQNEYKAYQERCGDWYAFCFFVRVPHFFDILAAIPRKGCSCILQKGANAHEWGTWREDYHVDSMCTYERSDVASHTRFLLAFEVAVCHHTRGPGLKSIVSF